MTSSETHECMFQEELSSSQTATWGEKLFPLFNTHPCQNCNTPKQEEEWLHSDSELALLLSSCSPLLFPQMLTQTYPRQASQNQSDQLLHVWERRGTVAVPDVGTAGIQNSPYRHTGINDIFTHAQQYAVEMVSELDRLVTNKNRGESVLTVTWGTLRNKKTLSNILMRVIAYMVWVPVWKSPSRRWENSGCRTGEKCSAPGFNFYSTTIWPKQAAWSARSGEQ